MNTHLTGLVVFGGGNMGLAIVRGALSAGLVQPAQVLVIEPDQAKHDELRALGVPAAQGADADAIARSGPDAAWLLAVKPQVFPELARALREAGLRPGGAVISVMAGTTARSIAEQVQTPRVVRVMPNLAVTVGQGMSAIAPGPGAGEQDTLAAEALFAAIGRTLRLPEPLMDAFTAVAGSGPAYLFLLAEAMSQGALAAGLSADQADAAVRQTLLGAATLLARSDAPPAVLRERVTSRGGTTAAALGVLNESGVVAAFERAILAARDRGIELAKPKA
jgi:pyrroline-5-carboxylate reductase